MRRINYLPRRALSRRLRHLRIVLDLAATPLGTTLLGICCLLCVAGAVEHARAVSLQAMLKRDAGRIAQLQREHDETNALHARISQLSSDLHVNELAQADARTAVQRIIDLGNTLPADVRLRTLAVRPDGTSSIDGRADHLADVARAIEVIRRLTSGVEVDFGGTNSPNGPNRAWSFSLSWKLRS
jgi:Tfp pilus assembly protein PilN